MRKKSIDFDLLKIAQTIVCAESSWFILRALDLKVTEKTLLANTHLRSAKPDRRFMRIKCEIKGNDEIGYRNLPNMD